MALSQLTYVTNGFWEDTNYFRNCNDSTEDVYYSSIDG